MNVYAESSAVLAWVLGEKAGSTIRSTLAEAEIVIASDLTMVECARALIRGVALGALSEGDAAERRARLDEVSASWHILRIGSDIVDRSRRPFPGEPIRTLDALHLASVLAARAAVPGIEILSLDARIRRAGRQLGFELQPRDPNTLDERMKTMDLEDLAKDFERVVDEVEQGARIIITRAGQPIARMVPAASFSQPDLAAPTSVSS